MQSPRRLVPVHSAFCPSSPLYPLTPASGGFSLFLNHERLEKSHSYRMKLHMPLPWSSHSTSGNFPWRYTSNNRKTLMHNWVACSNSTCHFPVGMYGCESWTIKLSAKELILLKCGVGEDSWESLRLQGGQTNQSLRKSVLNIHWKDWCWTWSSNTLATWCDEPTRWKRPWCWERLKAGGEVDDRDDWMASLTQWTWVWANSEREWRTGKPVVLQSRGWQRVRHDWATELNYI